MNRNELHKLIKNNRTSLQLIILISLLLHLILLAMLFLTHFHTTARPQFTPLFQDKIQQQLHSDLPASLKPRQSNFGIPVMFDTPPEPQEQPEEEAQQHEHNDPDKLLRKTEINKIKDSDPVSQEKIEELTQSQSVQREIKELNSSEIFEKKEENQKRDIQTQEHVAKKTSTLEFTEPEVKKPILQPHPAQQQQTIKQEKLELIEKMSEQPPVSLRSSPKDIEEPSSKAQEQQKKIEPQQPSQPPQRKRNLIAMTKGFLENLKDKGDDLLKRKGDDNKRPDFSEYKYLSYEARVNWHLQSAWKENAVPRQQLYEGKAVIEFVIDQNGNLTDLKLCQSSGNRSLDTMILENTQRAAPFPPLPQHFNTTLYKTGRIIKVSANHYGF